MGTLEGHSDELHNHRHKLHEHAALQTSGTQGEDSQVPATQIPTAASITVRSKLAAVLNAQEPHAASPPDVAAFPLSIHKLKEFLGPLQA